MKKEAEESLGWYILAVAAILPGFIGILWAYAVGLI